MMKFWEKIIIHDDFFLLVFVCFFVFICMFFTIWEDK